MEIVEHTPTKLTIQDFPVKLWAIGGFLAAVGLIMILNSRGSTFTCQREEPKQGSCQLTQPGFLGIGSQMREVPLNIVQGAKVEKSGSTDSKGRKYYTYRVVLLTETGEILFTDYSRSSVHDSIASEINSFIANPDETSRTYWQGDFGLFMGGSFFLGIGLLFAVGAGKIVTCSFDKSLDRVTLKRRGLLGTKAIEHSIQEIADVKPYPVSLVLKSGERVPFVSYRTKNTRGDQISQQEQQLVDRISAFLSLKNESSEDAYEGQQKQEAKIASKEQQKPEIASKEQKLEQEIAQWQEAIQLDPDDAEAHYRLGVALYRQGNRKEAGAKLELAKELFHAQSNSEKADRVQALIWEFGLE